MGYPARSSAGGGAPGLRVHDWQLLLAWSTPEARSRREGPGRPIVRERTGTAFDPRPILRERTGTSEPPHISVRPSLLSCGNALEHRRHPTSAFDPVGASR